MCNHPPDAQSRGSMCSQCWLAYVRASYDSQEEVKLVRKSIRSIEGASIWYLPSDAVLAVRDEEVTQLRLF